MPTIMDFYNHLKPMVNQMDKHLSKTLSDFIKKNYYDNNRKEIKLPDCLSRIQLNTIIDSSTNADFQINSFYPNLDVTISKNSSSSLSSSDELLLINLFTPNDLIGKQLSKMYDSINRTIGANDNNGKLASFESPTQFRSDFKQVTYFRMEPIIPCKPLSTNDDDNVGQQTSLNIHLKLLLQDMQFLPKNIFIVSHLDKQSKMDLLVEINNDCCQQKQPCRIVYLQSLSIMTYWMAMKANEKYNDRWCSIGYQIPLENKTSLNNSIIFFDVTTFIRVLNENSDMSMITHLFIDIDGHQTDNHNLFFNLLFLFLKENLKQLRHLHIIIMTSNGRQSKHMNDYFFSNAEIVDFQEYKRTSISNQTNSTFNYFFLDDFTFSQNSNTDPNKENKKEIRSPMTYAQTLMTNLNNPLEESDTAELFINECWLKNMEGWKFVLYFELFPWKINYQSKISEGITPLIATVYNGTPSDVYQLLLMGADCQLRSWNRMSPIEWALHFGREDIFQLLFAHQYATYFSFDLDLQHRYLINYSLVTNVNQNIIQMLGESKDLNYEVNYNLIFNMLLTMIEKLHCQQLFGSILIILPSSNSVSAFRKLILSNMGQFQYEFIMVCTYPTVTTNELNAEMGTLSSSKQNQDVKVILSTFRDCILFDDVRFVINTGVHLEKVHSIFSSTNLYRLIARRIEDQRILEQELSGQKQVPTVNIYNLYRRNDPLNFNDSLLMKNQSTDSLYHCIIMAKCFQFNRPKNETTLEFFDRMFTRPDQHIILNAIIHLKKINVLNENEELTELGRVLIDLSIEPHYAKMIIFSVILRCLDPILTIVCSLSSSTSNFSCLRTIVEGEIPTKNECLKGYSDHLTYVYAFQQWQEIYRSNNQNNQNGLLFQNNPEFSKQETSLFHSSSFEMIYSLRTKILGQLRAIGFVKGKGSMNIRQLNANSNNFSLVKAAICAGQPFDHFAIKIRTSTPIWQCYGPSVDEIIFVDPNSVLNLKYEDSNYPSNLVMFDRKIQGGKMSYVQNCTLINPLTMAIFADECQPTKLKDTNTMELNGTFRLSGPDLDKIFTVRQKWQQFVRKRLCNMQQMVNDEDEQFLKDLIHLIDLSDEFLGFNQHSNIGRPPKVMSAYFCSTIQIKK